jgi:hypothetical protein
MDIKGNQLPNPNTGEPDLYVHSEENTPTALFDQLGVKKVGVMPGLAANEVLVYRGDKFGWYLLEITGDTYRVVKPIGFSIDKPAA